ncbi:sulfotransferase domain-containing protein [Gammaproteobacteria bacterium]|nr:sulfotransferase domain-containing protein [Gammaproteobacteria bacterium]
MQLATQSSDIEVWTKNPALLSHFNLNNSYPRSGSHLLRFLIELLTEKPTCGCQMQSRDKPLYMNHYPETVPFNISRDNVSDFISYKYHSVTDVPWDKVNKYILLIRSPREAMIRMRGSELSSKDIDYYFSIIDSFLSFKDPKCLFFYEDMITKKSEFVKELAKFFGDVNPEKLEYVLKNIDHLYELSSKGKGRAWAGVKSKGQTYFYYQMAKKEEYKNWEPYLHEKIKDKKYDFIRDKYKPDYDNI